MLHEIFHGAYVNSDEKRGEERGEMETPMDESPLVKRKYMTLNYEKAESDQ